MIYNVDIRAAINSYKELDEYGRTSWVMEFACEQEELSTFINGGHLRIIKVNERYTLNYFVQIAYITLKAHYNTIPKITTKDLQHYKDYFIEHDFFNETVTPHPQLEEYLKICIHASDISPKAVKHITAVVCAVIMLYKV